MGSEMCIRDRHNTVFYHCLRKTTVYVGGINVECQVTEAATVTTLTTYKLGIATVLLINSTDGASVKFNQRSGLVRERERERERERDRERGRDREKERDREKQILDMSYKSLK